MTLGEARELRKSFHERGEFTLEEYRRALGPPGEFLDTIAAAIDREFAWTETPEERLKQSLFDLEGEFRLRGGRRIAKAEAQHHHVVEALEVDDEHVKEVRDRNANLRRLHEEARRLHEEHVRQEKALAGTYFRMQVEQTPEASAAVRVAHAAREKAADAADKAMDALEEAVRLLPEGEGDNP
jgi:hypothetical protein